MQLEYRLHEFSDEELLAELVWRNGLLRAPNSESTRDLDCLVGIGKNHSVVISFFENDLKALENYGDIK